MAQHTYVTNDNLEYDDAIELAHRWWVPAIRGVAAIIFGLLVLFAPGIGLVMLITLFGVYALVDGGFNLVLAARRGRAGLTWGWFVFEGLVSIAAGVVTFVWPGITTLWLLFMIAGWAIVTGVAEIAAAIRLRKQIRGELFLGLTGLLSIALGVLLIVFPSAGALAMVLWIGAYAVIFGGLLVALGFRLRSLQRRDEHHDVPTGSIPATR